MSRPLLSGARSSVPPRSYDHLPPHVRPNNQNCRGISPLNRPPPKPRHRARSRSRKAEAVKNCPPVKKSAARPHSPDYSKPSFTRPQERGLRVWYDEDKDGKDSPFQRPSNRKSHRTDHLAEYSLVPEDDVSPCLSLPHRRRKRHTKLKTDHRSENELIPVFARLGLEDVPRSDASAAAAAAAAAAAGDAHIQAASSEKVQDQECSRKRKLDDLKQEMSNKQRKLEAYRRELQASIDKKLKELRQEVTEMERKERASFKVTVDTQSGRRKVWRRKQGNSSTQKTSAQPRPLKRLPDSSQHPGSMEAASQ